MMMMMNHFSYKKCALATNSKLGRYVIATKNIKAGELLLTELPFVCGPHWNTKISCLNCYAAFNTVCEKCEVVPLCWNCVKHHDLIECETLEKLNVPKKFLFDHFNAAVPLRFLLILYRCVEEMKSCDGKSSLKSKIDDALSMESHCIARKGTWIWDQHTKNIVEPIRRLNINQAFKKLNSVWTISDEFLQKICGILDVNMFEVRTKYFGDFPILGLYVQAAIMSHDCIQNTFITLDDQKVLRVFANVDIKAGEVIHNNYTSVFYGTVARQQYLMNGKYFRCECNRCNDPTELGTHLSSLKCRLCSTGFMIRICDKSYWKCLNCQMNVSHQTIQKVLREIQQQIHQLGSNIHQIDNFILNYSQLLHSNHYLLAEVKQKMAALLRQKISTLSMDRKRDHENEQFEWVLKRKVELCQELIELLNVLQPGISRLKAIALYEQFLPLMQLCKLQHDQQLINCDEFVELLSNGETIAKESIRMLLYEPIMSPEGMLAKQIMHELKELREIKILAIKSKKGLSKC